MPDLEHLLADWRQSVGNHFRGQNEVLDELEDHLQGAVEGMVSRGEPLERAFEIATRQLGSADVLHGEFAKVAPLLSPWWPIQLIQAVALLLALGMIFPLIPRLQQGGFSALMVVHMGLVTLGYLSLLVVGILGNWFLIARLFKDLSPGQKESLKRSVSRWSILGAVLTGMGIALGTACPYEKTGWFFGLATHELGGLTIFVWGLVMAGGYWWLRGSSQVQLSMLLGLIGNMVIIIGWLGMTRCTAHSLGVLSSWPVIHLLIASQLILCCMVSAPVEFLRLRRA